MGPETPPPGQVRPEVRSAEVSPPAPPHALTSCRHIESRSLARLLSVPSVPPLGVGPALPPTARSGGCMQTWKITCGESLRPEMKTSPSPHPPRPPRGLPGPGCFRHSHPAKGRCAWNPTLTPLAEPRAGPGPGRCKLLTEVCAPADARMENTPPASTPSSTCFCACNPREPASLPGHHYPEGL